MSRGGAYSMGKRDRENQKARKKREKAERRRVKRERGPGDVEVVTADDITGELPTAEEAILAMEANAAAPQSANAIPCRLFVGGLSWDTNAQGLQAVFSQYGPVDDAFVVTDRGTGQSRGFGFVTFENRRDAAKAIEQLDGTELDGRRISVNIATDRQR
jgi:RNA recognition motif-containing protein